MTSAAVLSSISREFNGSGSGFRAFGKILKRGLTSHIGAVFFILLLGTTICSNAGYAQKQGREDQAAKAAQGNEEVVRLRARVEQLEEQLVDMQVTIGTVESLARKGGGGVSARAVAPSWGNSGSSTSPSSSGADSIGRIQVLETQIGALTRQVEQLSRRLGGGQVQNDGFQNPGFQNQGFGDMTVTPGADVVRRGAATQNANFDNRPPRVIYDEAYKYLLVQNYGAAESAFRSFLQQHSNDKLAGNAQYWLGESYYVRGQYKNAAGAFLKGYKVYSANSKAPDSLLKLAMSLKRLGQKDAACQTFGELGTRFPRAPQHIKQRAQSERRRSGC